MKSLLCKTCLLLILCGWLNAQVLTIHHIDVGQGDATLIRVSNGVSVLIDAGNTGKGNDALLPYLHSLGVTSLNYLMVSHYHADHIGGVDEVIDGLSVDSVGFVLDRGYAAPLPGTRAFTQYWSAAERVARHSAVALGQTIELSENVTLQCLVVDGSVFRYGEVKGSRSDRSLAGENNLSIAWLLSFQHAVNGKSLSFRYFTGGDCGGAAGSYADLETPLAAVVGDVDAMKVNHHGSRYSSNQAFVDSLRPEAVVISVGDRNTYGHPAQQTLDRLQTAKSVRFIYQTERGSGGTAPKVKILGTATIAVFDSFYTVGTDTFHLSSAFNPQNHVGLTTVRQFNKTAQGEICAFFENGVLVFTLADPSFVSIRLYNLLGQEVRNLAEGHFSPGSHRIDVKGLNLPSGVYLIRLSTPSETLVRKTIILR